MAKKPSMGRQKIKIQKIEVKNHLQVTFSKRRSGLFKKASELCTLCGVEISIIVFSPAGKVFSFGHPNVEPIIDRFLAPNPARMMNSDDPVYLVDQAQRNVSVRELNLQLGQILNELEVERKRGEDLDNMRKVTNYWWEAPVDRLGLKELEQVRVAMGELKKYVTQQANKLMNPTMTFASNGGGLFDQYESKPSHLHAPVGLNSTIAVANSNLGYCHGFF